MLCKRLCKVRISCRSSDVCVLILTLVLSQAEERTLWEAPTTYINMSPFMLANKIKKPILLIHGEEDNNPGTMTMQVL